jgi:23S rRNA (cytosine1962-C5)-methyltransferase
MSIANKWTEYELLDTGDGDRLERWGPYILRRPDPQIIWPIQNPDPIWQQVNAHYHRNASGGGHWEYATKLPEKWMIRYGEHLKFIIKPTSFKHMGLFPEQAVNWDWIIEKIQSANRPIRVLNLFAYTGGATVAAAYAGASVCHVDASKGVVQWAKENLHASDLADRSVRFITDDVFKFLQREVRRGSQYDAIIMDPPTYGRGTQGEVWRLEEHLYSFLQACLSVLSPNPLFLLINSYVTGISSTVLQNLLSMTVSHQHRGTCSHGEIGLPITHSSIQLPCGIFARWEASRT